jgi:aflatoxin B1 aldehyde reductase
VQEVYDVAEQNGFVKPTVFQGNYNAVARLVEDDLFPLLRKLKIAFYAYSPIAGGFLAKTSQQVRDGLGRFSPDGQLYAMYSTLYSKPTFFAALDKWDKIASDAGVKKVELAYRWITYHSALKGDLGDGVIFGASLAQLDETVAAIKAGPLADDIVARIDELWPSIKGDALVDNLAAIKIMQEK